MEASRLLFVRGASFVDAIGAGLFLVSLFVAALEFSGVLEAFLFTAAVVTFAGALTESLFSAGALFSLLDDDDEGGGGGAEALVLMDCGAGFLSPLGWCGSVPAAGAQMLSDSRMLLPGRGFGFSSSCWPLDSNTILTSSIFLGPSSSSY